MMLRRSQATPYLWERKKFTGPLDIRAPEDRPVVEQQNAPAAPIRSPAIDKALGDFGEAMRSGLVDAMKHAARSVVDATSAYYRMSGVPTFAHEPVPWQLIEHALPVEHLAPGEHADQAVGRFVDVFDDSVKPMLKVQLSKYFEQPGIVDALKSGESESKSDQSKGPAPSQQRRRIGEFHASPHGGAGKGEREFHSPNYLNPIDWASKFLGPRSDNELRASSIQDSENKGATYPERGRMNGDGETRFQNNKGASVWTSSLDSIANGEFGRRPGEGDGPEGKAVPLVLPLIVGVAARERASKAIRSAGYSIAADVIVTLIANRLKPEKERKWPTWQSLLTSGLSGAATGAMDFGPDQWKYEAGVAFLGSAAEDALEGKPTKWFAAIGAGVGAGLYAKYGKEAFKKKFGDKPLAQAVGKTISKMIKEVFSAEVELAEAEVAEFIEGFMRAIENADEAADYWQRQFDEWFWQGDQDPIL